MKDLLDILLTGTVSYGFLSCACGSKVALLCQLWLPTNVTGLLAKSETLEQFMEEFVTTPLIAAAVRTVHESITNAAGVGTSQLPACRSCDRALVPILV